MVPFGQLTVSMLNLLVGEFVRRLKSCMHTDDVKYTPSMCITAFSERMCQPAMEYAFKKYRDSVSTRASHEMHAAITATSIRVLLPRRILFC
jgi:hypothetical protein